MSQTTNKQKTTRRSRGFAQTGGLLSARIRKASEKRGFAETRLLTQWAEFAGEAVASIARPVKVSYGRQGFGATLTLLCQGAQAPMLEMQIPQIIQRVNSCYGYAAISKIRITQTAASGFAEQQAPFAHAPEPKVAPEKMESMQRDVNDVSDTHLREALSNLGKNVLKRRQR